MSDDDVSDDGFEFYTFHIGPDRPECLNEYLEILDGPSESSTLLRKLCGSSVPRAVRSSNNTMTVRFVANGLIASEQFGGKFQKQRALRDYLRADEGNFTSPGYPRNCPSNRDSIWRIEIKEQFGCKYDYVEVYDGHSEVSPLLLKLCGLVTPAPLASTNNTMTVRFVTDEFQNIRRFLATFTRAKIGNSESENPNR
ncbi:Dorsal-ventral patterning tolloid-like protein 1 [Sparganum proliferum]